MPLRDHRERPRRSGLERREPGSPARVVFACWGGEARVPGQLVPVAAHRRMCYIRYMREWMREKMRRRSKRGPNNSEATGKIGQEIPANQPAPLRPSYEAAPSEPASANPEPKSYEPGDE